MIDKRAAEIYDVSVADWEGEIDFYRALVTEMSAKSVLEIGCGTGRIAVRLARDGLHVVGVDLSPAMLDVARAKNSNARWIEGDMRSFEAGERFDLAIIPGHSFQFMLTPNDQLAALACAKQHLKAGGRLVIHLDHQDVKWLGKIHGEFERAKDVTHPKTGHTIQTWRAWKYERATQTASATTRWKEVGGDGNVLDEWETGTVQLHCLFRFEMEHLLVRAGFEIEALYGDFLRGDLREESSEMVWVVRKID
jgi:SAM-dependent methyltransferase